MSRGAGFWLLAAVLGFLLAAASAPSPLYAVYSAKWAFSSTTLTAIFAVYAFALLAALLTAGQLSDHLGRRPVLAVALVVQTAGMVAFVVAQSVAALYVARILQGIGTGIATGAISAWLLDLEPPDRPGLGSGVGSIAPMAGLAAGALGSGLLVQYGPDPLRLVYWLLTGVFLAALAALPSVPDEVPRSPGWLASLRLEIGVPREARPLFAALFCEQLAYKFLFRWFLDLAPRPRRYGPRSWRPWPGRNTRPWSTCTTTWMSKRCAATWSGTETSERRPRRNSGRNTSPARCRSTKRDKQLKRMGLSGVEPLTSRLSANAASSSPLQSSR